MLPDNPLRRLILAAAGDRIAFASGRDGRVLRYRELARTAEAVRRQLRQAGLGEGTRAALLSRDPLAFAAAYLSLLAADLSVVPLNSAAPSEEARARLEMFHPDLLVTDDADGLLWQGPTWSWEGPTPRHLAGCRPRPRPDVAPGVLLTSSGTTGEPKVVPLGLGRLLTAAYLIAAHHRLGPGDRGYSPLPLFHVNAQVVGLLATLVGGASLVLDPRFSRSDFWEEMRAWRVTWLNAVPAILAILARERGPDEATAARVRFARSASAPLSLTVLADFQLRTGVSVLETYGMSEAASQIAANPLERRHRRAGSVGLPVGVRLRVVDEDRRPLPAGAVGSVEIQGPTVIDAYLVPGRPEGRRRALTPDGWLVTGDVGHLDRDGFLFLTGRADDVINRGGEKVYPREIEEVLRSCPGVVEAAVVGQPDPVLGQCPIAYVTAAPGMDPAQLVGDLQRLCAQRLDRSRRPARLAVLDRLPAGPTGKVSRRRLAELEPQRVLAS